MATQTLGLTPAPMILALARGGDFATSLDSPEPWPAGTAARILVGDRIWEAEVAGGSIRFNIDKDEVAEVLNQKPRRFRLVYSDGAGADLVWAAGEVHAYG